MGAALLRLAVLLGRSHEPEALPDLQLLARGDRLELALPARWLEARPLLRSDLENEMQEMTGLGLRLQLTETAG